MTRSATCQPPEHRTKYTNDSRLKTVTDNSGLTPLSATYSYLANSPLVSQIAFQQNGTPRMITTKQYDSLNRLTDISSAVPGSPSFASFSYVYNQANQRTRRTEADGSYWRYRYDPLGQVTYGKKFWPDQSPVAGQQFEYAFDDIGNRTSTQAGGDQNGASLRPANYSANSLNQYTSRDVPGAVDVIGLAFATNAVTVNNQTPYRRGEYFRKELAVDNSAGPVWTNITVSSTGQSSVGGHAFVPKTQEHFFYDYDGNLTNDGRWTYTWDAESRLVAMAANTNLAQPQLIKFEYDSKGRRIHKQVWNDTNSTPVTDLKFLYDGWNLFAELNTENLKLRTYLWGPDLSGSLQGAGGVGGLLEVTYHGAQATNCFVAFDGNGNVAGLVNATNGTTVAQYEYGPFGEVIRATGPMANTNPFRFSTKFQDDETDIVMYPRRPWRDGRFLSRDLSAELSAQPATPLPTTYSDTELTDADEPDGNSMPDFQAMVRPTYRFVDNDSINRFDPLGEDIYLQRGNNTPTPNRWLHMSVCVDTWHCIAGGGWQKTGKACFSFWATGFRFSLPSNRWLGWREFNAGGPLEGKIYQDPYVSGKVVAQLKTTAKQDMKWYMYMLVTRVATADTYSLARHNCRRYSRNEFRDAPWNMGLP